ncbi:MAG: hypothetical protein WCL00_04970, partial [Bacteroidota bacterium]
MIKLIYGFRRGFLVLLPVLALLFLSGNLQGQFYNGSQLQFGKSRVQYSEFYWMYYRFDKFDTYFYLKSKELALYTSEFADKHIKEIEMELESNLEQKIQFVIFNSLSDLKESNIGLTGDYDSYNTGGVTRIIGGKVLLYFDGNYGHFEQQIRAGIAQVILNEMIHGAGIGAQIKNNALFTMPEWYLNGLISYISEKWNTEIDNQVKDAYLAGKYNKFNHLTGLEAAYAGHSLWHYISLKYGPSTIPNIVYMARLSRNVEKGFLYVLGVNFKDLIQEWLNFYQGYYGSELMDRTDPAGNLVTKKIKADWVYGQLKINPEGRLVAYTTHELGVYKVFLTDLVKHKTKRIFRGGYRIAEKPDYTYPLVAWHPSGKMVAFILEKKGEVYLYFYKVKEKKLEKIILHDFQKVLDFSYSENGEQLVFSATQKCQSDIFVYNIVSATYRQITKDIYDDLQPRFINHSKDIIFSSNRESDTIRFDVKTDIKKLRFNNDIFIYHYSTKKNLLDRVTKTPNTNEVQPMPYSDNYFCYLSDQNGIYNRVLARYDSAVSFIDTTTHYRYFTTSWPVTNYSRSILEQDVNPVAGMMGEVVFKNQQYRMYFSSLQRPRDLEKPVLQPTNYRENQNKVFEEEKAIIKNDSNIKKEGQANGTVKKHFSTVHVIETMPSGNVADTVEKSDRHNLPVLITQPNQDSTSTKKLMRLLGKAQKDTANKYTSARPFNYNVAYSIDQMVTQLDFNYLNRSYQPFTGAKYPIFINPGFNALFMVGITDLMEDYRLTGGVRLDFNLVDNEYLFSYMNMRKRVDHQFIYHRQTVEDVTAYSYIRHKINEVYYLATYPFSPVLSLRGTASVKYDKAVYLSTDQYNLKQPNIDKYWGSVKGELTYDNTRNVGLNLYYGTRYKIFGEYYQQLNGTNSNMVVLGADIR